MWRECRIFPPHVWKCQNDVCEDVVCLRMGAREYLPCSSLPLSLSLSCMRCVVCVCVCLLTLTWMSECMCDTVLHECHTENWVWVVLQAKVSCSLFSNKPIGGKGGGAPSCRGIPPLESWLHFYEPGCSSGPFWTLMKMGNRGTVAEPGHRAHAS